MLATTSSSVFAAGVYDLTDPDYLARAADMATQGRIQEACLPANAPPPDAGFKSIAEPSAELIAAAEGEGQLVINSGIGDETSISSYKAAFEARFPKITVTAVSGSSATFEARFLGDHANGNQSADAAITSHPEWVADGYKQGALVPLDQTIPDIFEAWPQGSWVWEVEGGATAVAFYRSLGIGYNSDLVPDGLEPEQWADLARPEFKGQLIAVDPAATLAFARVYKHMLDVVGEDTFRAIGENMIKNPLYADIQPASQALGAGAGMVIIELGANVGAALKRDGAPVEVVMPDSTTGTQYAFGVASAAPHPSAAKLFANWLYSAEGQWVLSCAAFSGSAAYSNFGSETFVPIEEVSDEEIAHMKDLLGL
ncbi:MAG TPA: extracellular solute-binding protein [Devosia sp.]|nr:extracellular solute-binding protein [Devosia sp.]